MRTCFLILVLQSYCLLYAKDYCSNVVRTQNGAYINIPSVMQIKKGCNLSSATMLLQYFGIDVSPQELKSNRKRTQSYRSRTFVNQQVKSLGFQITKLPATNLSEFSTSVKRAIDVGIPLWWECDLALAPTSDQQSKKKIDLHRRLINGYITHKNKIIKIYYSDSWGEKHINKQMRVIDAYRMSITNTSRLSLVYPNDLDPNILKAILPDEKFKVAQGAENELMSKQEVNTSPINKRPLPSWRKRQLETDRMADEILAKEAEKKGK